MQPRAARERLGTDNEQARRVNAVLVLLPPLALAGDVGVVLLGGAKGFAVSRSSCRKRHTAS
jgi:hypothetical protein